MNIANPPGNFEYREPISSRRGHDADATTVRQEMARSALAVMLFLMLVCGVSVAFVRSHPTAAPQDTSATPVNPTPERAL